MREVKIIENVVYDHEIKDAGLLDIYVPELTDGEKASVLIYFHGGGLESGDKKDDKGVYTQLASHGVVVISANYRMYPDYGYPVFVEDAAKVVAYTLKHINEYASHDKVWIGGISAGAYLSMMLHFVPKFLQDVGVKESDIFGYFFDDGQPTTHFNVLRERGMDTRAVRVDETAPIYYLVDDYKANLEQQFFFIWTDDDIPGRAEQNAMMIRTMEIYGYRKEQIHFQIMEGYAHAQHVCEKDDRGEYPYAELLWGYIKEYE